MRLPVVATFLIAFALVHLAPTTLAEPESPSARGVRRDLPRPSRVGLATQPIPPATPDSIAADRIQRQMTLQTIRNVISRHAVEPAKQTSTARPVTSTAREAHTAALFVPAEAHSAKLKKSRTGRLAWCDGKTGPPALPLSRLPSNYLATVSCRLPFQP